MTTTKSATLASALATAFAQFEAAAKDANNPHFKTKYADLPSVIDAVKPALIANRLFFTQATHDVEGGVCIETMVHHESGESMSFGRLFVPASKNDAQGFGSALTYARRYSLMTALGIPAEDDDGHAAAKTAPARRSAAADLTRAKIDEAQWACLTQMIEAKGADTRKFCEWLGVESLKDIDACDFFRAKEALSKKADKAKPVEEIIADEVPY